MGLVIEDGPLRADAPMCELFALSSRDPVALCCSLEEFDRHSDGPGGHADGWGLARYVDRDVLLLKEDGPAAGSELARWTRERPLASRLAISHLRRATQGGRGFMNCQPFMRELGGAAHVFAHNGHLDPAGVRSAMSPAGPRPIGETDSEHAFCAMLDALTQPWAAGLPPLHERARIVSDVARRLRELGPANFLYADGDALFAHAHRRMHGSEGIRPPGMWMLELPEGTAAACGRLLGIPASAQAAAGPAVLFASVPLSAEPRWRALDEGQVVVVRAGTVVEEAA
jgi:glutamine amidotransferase